MKYVYLMIIILFSIFIVNGCYTMLEHPKVNQQEMSGENYLSDVHFYDDCSSCHNDRVTDYHNYSPTVNAISPYNYDGYYGYENYGAYSSYYNTPWWYSIPTPVIEGTKYRNDNENSNNTAGTSRDNSSSRNSGGRSSDPNNHHDRNRAVLTNSGSSSNTSNTNSVNGSSSTRSTTEDSSSKRNSDSPKTRENQGDRSKSGRR